MENLTKQFDINSVIDYDISNDIRIVARPDSSAVSLAINGTVKSEKTKVLVSRHTPSDGNSLNAYYLSPPNTVDFNSKLTISDEAKRSGVFTDKSEIFGLISKDLINDKQKNLIKTILTKHVDLTKATGESWKNDKDRDPAYFPAVSASSSLDSIISLANDDHKYGVTNILFHMEAMVSPEYIASSRWFMNRNSRRFIRSVRDQNGLVLTAREDGTPTLLGYPITITDELKDSPVLETDNPEDSVFIMFGSLPDAMKVSDIENIGGILTEGDGTMSNGAKSYDYQSKYSVYSLDNTALVVCAGSVT